MALYGRNRTNIKWKYGLDEISNFHTSHDGAILHYDQDRKTINLMSHIAADIASSLHDVALAMRANDRAAHEPNVGGWRQ